MDTNRTLLKRIFATTCLASLALCAGTASAQMIYKQVDTDGRVIFTDQPSAAARVVASYDTGRPSRAEREEPRADVAVDASRREMVPNFTASTERPSPALGAVGPVAPIERTKVAEDVPGEGAIPPVPRTPPAAVRTNDVERAVFTYKPLDTPLAAQVDATEAARRARQDGFKNPVAAGVLVVKPLAPEHEAVKAHEGVSNYYVMWAVTFFLMATGLLFVGWQTFRLILGGAFPRWNLGTG